MEAGCCKPPPLPFSRGGGTRPYGFGGSLQAARTVFSSGAGADSYLRLSPSLLLGGIRPHELWWSLQAAKEKHPRNSLGRRHRLCYRLGLILKRTMKGRRLGGWVSLQDVRFDSEPFSLPGILPSTNRGALLLPPPLRGGGEGRAPRRGGVALGLKGFGVWLTRSGEAGVSRLSAVSLERAFWAALLNGGAPGAVGRARKSVSSPSLEGVGCCCARLVLPDNPATVVPYIGRRRSGPGRGECRMSASKA